MEKLSPHAAEEYQQNDITSTKARLKRPDSAKPWRFQAFRAPTFASCKYRGRGRRQSSNHKCPCAERAALGTPHHTDQLRQHCPLRRILELTQNTKFREQTQPPAQAEAPAGCTGRDIHRVQSGGRRDWVNKAPGPRQPQPQEGQSPVGFAASVALAAAHMAGSCLHPLQPALCALSGQGSRREGRRRRGNRKS